MEYKNIWFFFSVVSVALEDNIDVSILNRWRDIKLFSGCPFGKEDRYICQGVKQIRLWLDDMKEDPKQMERLRQDYLQLFVGTPTPYAPLFGSFYIGDEKLVFQEKTAQVGEWYRKYGLTPRQEKGMPDDYLLYELLFVTALMEEYQKDIKRGHQKEAKQYLKVIQQFAREQMLDWISSWREDVMLYSRTEYYRGLSNMIYGGIRCLVELEVME